MNLSIYSEKDQRIIKLISDAILFNSLKNKLTHGVQMFTGGSLELDIHSYSFEIAEQSFFNDRGIEHYSDDEMREKTWDAFWEPADQIDFSKCVTEHQHGSLAESIFLKWEEILKSVTSYSPTN